MDHEAVVAKPLGKRIFYNEISIARGIGILLVVLGHAFPDASSGITNMLARYIWSFIYSFHMSLFIFISGFLGSKCIDLTDWDSRKTFIWRRCKRLLIPYVCMTFAYLPLKVVMSEFASNSYNLSTIWQILLGVSPNYELWTLYTLFLLATYSCFFVNRKNIILHLIVWIFIMLAAYLILDIDGMWYKNAVGIYYFLQYGFFYLLGIVVCTKYDKIRVALGGGKFLLASLLILVSAFVLDKILYNNFSLSIPFIKIITSLAGTGLILSVSYELSRSQKMKWLKLTGNYCMDIYILSAFIQPAFRIIFYNILGMEYWTYTVFSSVLTVLLSIMLSKYILRKIPYVRTVVLGMD